VCVGWRRLSTESAGDGEKRRRLTGLVFGSGTATHLVIVLVLFCFSVRPSSAL